MKAKRHLYQFITILLACVCTASGSAWSNQESVTPREVSAFDVQPYLFVHGSGRLALGWRYVDNQFSSGPVRVQVYLGTSLFGQVDAKNDGVSWSADLPVTECGFGNQVSYFVPGMSQRATITPIPCPNEHQPARFSFIADAQEGPEFLEDIAKEVASFPGSAILSGGDLVQEGARMQDWLDYFRAMQNVGGSRVTYAAIGNHEYRSQDANNYWQNYFRMRAHQAYYSTYIGGVHLIVLNSNFEDELNLIEPEVQWLKSELAKPATWKVVMFHHSPFSKGFFNGPAAIRKEHIVLRERFVPLFEAYGVQLVLTGHTHIFERSVKNGIQYLVAGPAGGKMGVYGALNSYSIHSARERTVTHIEANDNGLRAVTLSINGRVLDDFTLTHPNSRTLPELF
jgi:predicted MPP superfamily phosphohydrolase